MHKRSEQECFRFDDKTLIVVTLTYGLVAGHSDQTVLLDVGFGGGIASSGMDAAMIDA